MLIRKILLMMMIIIMLTGCGDADILPTDNEIIQETVADTQTQDAAHTTAIQETAVDTNTQNIAQNTASTDVTKTTVEMYIQEPEHLYLDSSSKEEMPMDNDCVVLNYEFQIGTWIPFMKYQDLMKGKTANEIRQNICEEFKRIKCDGFNTVYVHVRSHGDAYYKSELFPKGMYLTGDYDPLAIMLEEAHILDLSLHAWVNPFRVQTEAELDKLPDTYMIKKWFNEKRGTYIVEVNGRYYLNPGYEDVIDFVVAGIDEILCNYKVDGIHIDDYFYPTTAASFDDDAFLRSGENDRTKWRLNNITRLVRDIYCTVKNNNCNVLFGISPQGSIDANYTSQFADVRLWAGTDGYCDYILPQIYYGFENQFVPFEPTLREWERMASTSNVSLVIGLAGYKQGKVDEWAGTGADEWIENDDVIQRQIDMILDSTADGYAIYY